MKQKCYQCGKSLDKDEKGICQKYLAPKQERLCLDHLALYLNITREMLEDKIEELKEGGCPLFG